MSDVMSASETKPAVLDRSRALVFVERRHGPRSAVQAPAGFVAQLIACEKRIGEFRRARRDLAALGTKPYRPKLAAPSHGLDVLV